MDKNSESELEDLVQRAVNYDPTTRTKGFVERWKVIEYMLKKGLTPGEIQALVPVNISTIYRVAKENGIKKNGRTYKAKRDTEELINFLEKYIVFKEKTGGADKVKKAKKLLEIVKKDGGIQNLENMVKNDKKNLEENER